MRVPRQAAQSLLELALVFAVFYLPGMFWPADQAAADTGRLAWIMGQSLLGAVPQVLLLGYLIWLRGTGTGSRTVWEEFGIPRPRAIDLAWALLLVAGVFLLLGGLAAVQTLLPDQTRRLLQGGFRWRLSDPRLLPLAALFSLSTGYREELFFRAYLLTRLGQLGLPPAAAVAVSGLLFAFGHAYQGPAGLAVALLLGIYFAAVFLRLRNLHRLAWAHGLYNFAVLLVTLFADALPWPAPPGGIIFELIV